MLYPSGVLMEINPYKLLALRLDFLPNGFPATEDGVELKLLAKLFSPEEAALASQLRPSLETSDQIAKRIGGSSEELKQILKGMARRGLITCARVDKGIGFGIMPFVVGFYEMQVNHIDRELASLFEAYYQTAASKMFAVEPQFHRVVPVAESIPNNLEIQPFESVKNILNQAKAWGVVDCICRKQKALIGKACQHPLDVCMVLSPVSGAFDNSKTVQRLTLAEAEATLHRAAEAGLVHSVSNNQKGIWYICNCCTCSCGILRGIAELGLANVVARSAFVSRVDKEICIGCETCLPFCQFGALSCDLTAYVDEARCVGCGICVYHCPENAIKLEIRPIAEIKPPPANEFAWREARARARGLL